jgi:hypothetical protein
VAFKLGEWLAVTQIDNLVVTDQHRSVYSLQPPALHPSHKIHKGPNTKPHTAAFNIPLL